MRQTCPALIFGPGLPPGGVEGTLSVSSLGIEVLAHDRSRRADLNDVRLREVGFERFGLELAWADGDERWAAHVLDSDAANTLMQSHPLDALPQAMALRSRKNRQRAGRSVGWALFAGFVLLPLILLLTLILNAGRIASVIAEKIPVEQEMQWGRQAFASMRSSLRIRESGPGIEAVRNLGGKLTSGSEYRYEFYVAEDDTLNAFAIPGGIIVVHSGLIAATKRPEELAGVLAHEVQHVELRHSVRGMVKELGLRGLWAFVIGDLGGTLIGQAALEITSLKFSRDDESEADAHGFDALVRANIDPTGMPEFFKTMSEKSADAPVAFISTHPLSTERQAVLTQRAAELNRQFAKLEMGQWPPQ